MRRKIVAQITNFVLIATGTFIQISFDGIVFAFTYFAVILSLVISSIAILVFEKMAIFDSPREKTLEDMPFKDKLILVKIIQITIIIFLVLLMFNFNMIIDWPIGLMILPTLVPFSCMFGVPGYVAYKYEVLYQGIFFKGGKYLQGKEAKEMGSLLLGMFAVIMIGIIFIIIAPLLSPYS